MCVSAHSGKFYPSSASPLCLTARPGRFSPPLRRPGFFCNRLQKEMDEFQAAGNTSSSALHDLHASSLARQLAQGPLARATRAGRAGAKRGLALTCERGTLAFLVAVADGQARSRDLIDNALASQELRSSRRVRGLSSVGRATALQAEGPGFDAPRLHQNSVGARLAKAGWGRRRKPGQSGVRAPVRLSAPKAWIVSGHRHSFPRASARSPAYEVSESRRERQAARCAGRMG